MRTVLLWSCGTSPAAHACHLPVSLGPFEELAKKLAGNLGLRSQTESKLVAKVLKVLICTTNDRKVELTQSKNGHLCDGEASEFSRSQSARLHPDRLGSGRLG